ERRSLDELGASREALARSRDELEQQVIDRTRQLTLARDAAEHANRAKSEFLSRMSHELRTPMNAVLGFAQLMTLEPGQPPRVHGFLDHILRAGKHLLHLINDVLDLAHVESGRLTLSPEPLEVEAIVREVAALMQPLADQHGVTLAAQLAAGSVVRGDRLRLKQVLLNLVSNAIKYNRPGGEVRVGAEAQADGSTRITIADTGQGIAPEGMAELFEPFARLGREQGSIEGTGIGLSISKRLVEMMGGRIGAASRLGEGSRFWIDLPGDRLAPGPAPRTTGFGELAEPPVERPALVLYVEDNPANVDLMRHIVDRHAHIRLITAPSAALGLDLARSHRPDLILMDIHLPDVSGYTALARLQEDPATRDIPVMAITANAMPGESDKALDAGFVDYLTKPLDVSRFDVLLRSALRARPGA
ncbi:MAG TPA: ATP-binding protein, partial [Methylibium sp.]|nr:ATP-binding protein [Methylibium sp.]